MEEAKEPDETAEPIEEPVTEEIKTSDSDKPKSRIARYAAEIQAFSLVASVFITLVSVAITGLLAYYAYKSWEEVKQQREIAHKQFVVATEPSLRIYIKDQFHIKDDYAYTKWDLTNTGGPVRDIVTKTIVIFYKASPPNNEPSKKVTHNAGQIGRLNRSMTFHIYISTQKPEVLTWIKEAVKTSNQLFVYAQADFVIPEELTLDGIAKKDKLFKIEKWAHQYNKFIGVSHREQDKIIKFIKEKGFLEQLDDTAKKHNITN